MSCLEIPHEKLQLNLILQNLVIYNNTQVPDMLK